MKILYVAPKYDYGLRERGFSFEHYNFFDSLLNMGNEIIYFDYMDIYKKWGKARMNNFLLEVFQSEKPELMFVFLFENELDPKIITRISKSKNVITMNWFADDHWRFDNYSRYWAPHFNWVVTTDFEAVPKYKAMGYNNVILSQWACNHFLYRKLNLEQKYDVSFIGQAYGNRRSIIEAIRKTGVDVLTRGHGWDSGRASQKEMIEIFNQSKINLNLSNASVKSISGWMGYVDRFALYTPGVKRIWRKMRSLINFGSPKGEAIYQIKGRNFEVPGCGGFFLTDYVKGLDNYYSLDKDIVCYKSINELTDKIHYYLQNDNLRKKIAFSGWKKTLDSHTYVHRFNDIFLKIGLDFDFSLESKPGKFLDVIEVL